MMVAKPLLPWWGAGGGCTLAPLDKPFTPAGCGLLVWEMVWLSGSLGVEVRLNEH